MTTEPEHPDDHLVRAEPHDLPAEQALVGSVPLARDPRRLLRELHLTDSDFYRPAHATIYAAYGALLEAGQPIDPITVTNRLQAQGDLGRIGGPGYLHTCIQAAERGANPEWIADHLRALALRRQLIQYGRDVVQAAFDPTGGDEAAAELAEQAVAQARTVRDAGRAAEDQPVEDIHDFLAHPDEGYDWVLPGLLERTDRIVWTAGEGGGKSVLQRQLAVCAAAGVMPFGGEPSAIGPQRVLVLDCENSARQSRRQYRALMNVAERQRTPVKRGQLHIDLRPEGVDLTRPDGRAWLMRRVEAVMPDLLIVGPIYRLHAGDPNSEELARKVTVVLDEARATAGCALSLEAHSPQGNGMGPRALRPVGSSLWLRWPEFGYGLRPVEDQRTAEEDRGRRVIPWRGARDERSWPAFICQGHEGGWPWRQYRPIDTNIVGYSPTGALS
ncbi:replicative DNA helicase [Streptomyces sp. TLI_235]|nr:AAA family ATPase [Streptomyces sp. TLI_235]PBC71531.1 replicative DNA helicase [Streptomyces sp. TLI_235]